MKYIFFIILIPLSCFGDINQENHDFSAEYGAGYHTLRSNQKSNNSKGKLTSFLNPYWIGAYSFRAGSNTSFKLFGGFQTVRVDKPETEATLILKDQILSQFGIEMIKKNSSILKKGFFVMQQEHPLIYAKTPTTIELIKKKFVQTGIHLSVGQRRRIGFLWGLGIKGHTLFPTAGGDVTTEIGVGGESYARIGWVGPFGVLYQIKGIYHKTVAPNANVEFSHEFIGYCFQVSHSF